MLISALAILAFLLAPGLAAQHIEFEVDDQEPMQGQVINISNQSEELPEGAYFVFIFQQCAFTYENAITCQLQTQDHQWSFEGFFWNSGSFTIQLIGINQEGDTLEMQAVKEINVMPFTVPNPIDSCPDSSYYNCNNQNLVCNGSFEWTASNVNQLSEITLAAPWRNLLGSSDLFSSSSLNPWWTGVPQNQEGFQYAQQGGNHSGILIDWGGDFDLYTESMMAPLKDTLLVGQRYLVEAWVNKADYYPMSLSGLQIGFSDTQLSPNNHNDLINQVNPEWIMNPLGDSILTDTSNWVYWRDVFIPDTNTLSWVLVGYLIDTIDILKSVDSSVTNPYWPGTFDHKSRYFIDNVSIHPIEPDVYLPDTVWICQGDTVTLKVTGWGASNYHWSTSAITDSIVVSPQSSTDYTVSVASPSGCYDDAVILHTHVGVYSIPTDIDLQIIGENNDCDTIGSYWPNYHLDNHIYKWSMTPGTGYFIENGLDTIAASASDRLHVMWSNLPPTPSFAEIRLLLIHPCGDTIGTDTMRVFRCCYRESVDYLLFANDTIQDNYVDSAVVIFINGEVVLDNCLLHLLAPSGSKRNKIFFGPEAALILKDSASVILEKTDIAAGCEYMWQSIHLTSSGSRGIQMIDCKIQDGIEAIKIDSAAPLFISASAFLNNYNSIIYQNGDFYPIDSSFIDPPYHYSLEHFKLDSCRFTQEIHQLPGLPYPPFQGNRIRTGIHSRNISTLKIGGPGIDTNYFEYMLYGIFAEDTDLEVYNTKFDSCGQGMLNISPDPCGIYAIRQASCQQPKLIKIGEGQDGFSNSFVSCKLGVNILNMSADVNGNYFSNCDYGIRVIEPRQSTRVTNNRMQQFPTSRIGKTGIQVQSVNPGPRAPSVIIDTNSISGYEKGIWTTNLMGISNTVRIAADTVLITASSNNAISGIKVENCDGMYIGNNVIAGKQLPTSVDTGRHNGIWVSATGAAGVKHNRILRVGHGIYTTGSLLLTNFICNDLDSCYNGFYFGPYTALSDQGYPDLENPLNRFMGDYGQGLFPYYRRMGGIDTNIINPPVDWYYPNQYSVYDPGINSTYNTHNLYGRILDFENNGAQVECTFDTTVYDPFSLSGAQERQALLGDIVYKNNSYNILEPENINFEQDLFVEITSSRPEVLSLGDSSDFSYYTFFDSLSYEPQGLRNYILALMDMGLWDMARNANDAIIPSSPWEKSRKKVNTIYLNSWRTKNHCLPQQEYDSLMLLALSSPYHLGDAVFSARVMLGLDPDEHHITYSQSAEPESIRRKEIIVFPNPADHTVCFQNLSGESLNNSLIEIFDISGKLVLNQHKSIPGGEKACASIVQLKPGIYLVRLVDYAGSFIYTERLVIY